MEALLEPVVFNKGQGIPYHYHVGNYEHYLEVDEGCLAVQMNGRTTIIEAGDRILHAANTYLKAWALLDGTKVNHKDK